MIFKSKNTEKIEKHGAKMPPPQNTKEKTPELPLLSGDQKRDIQKFYHENCPFSLKKG